MADEEDAQPGSSWRRWTAGAAPEPSDAGLDVQLDWPQRDDDGPAGGFGSRGAEPDPDPEPDLAEPEAAAGAEPEWDDEVGPPPVASPGDLHDDAAADADDLWIDDEPAGREPEEGLDDDEPWTEPMLPAMASRIDVVQGGVHSLGMRLEALVAATSSLRNTLGDRVDDYTATVSRLSANSARDLDEYRRSTERALGELRRASIATDEVLSQLGARADELSSDVLGLHDLLHSLTEDIRAAGNAARVRPGPSAEHRELVEAVGALRGEFTALRVEAAKAAPTAGPASTSELLDALAVLREEVADLRAEVARRGSDTAGGGRAADGDSLFDVADALDALRVQVAGLQSAGGGPRAATDADLDVAAGLLDEVRHLSSSVSAVGGAVGSLAEIRELLAVLVDALPDSQEGSEGIAWALARLAERVELLATRPPVAVDLDDLADRIAARLGLEAPAPARPRPPRRRTGASGDS